MAVGVIEAYEGNPGLITEVNNGLVRARGQQAEADRRRASDSATNRYHGRAGPSQPFLRFYQTTQSLFSSPSGGPDDLIVRRPLGPCGSHPPHPTAAPTQPPRLRHTQSLSNQSATLAPACRPCSVF